MVMAVGFTLCPHPHCLHGLTYVTSGSQAQVFPTPTHQAKSWFEWPSAGQEPRPGLWGRKGVQPG